jgi:cobalt-zinc-cadmium resistance protein CzcA
VVVVAALLFLAFGLHAASELPIDAVPDITNVQVQVVTTAPALSPVEAEQYVTIPVERAMAGIPHATEVRSISKYGMSVVTIVFQDGTDIYFARQLVNERLRDAADAVPERYGRPEMGPITTGLGEIYQFVVRNDRLSLMQLEELLDWQIGPQLRTVPGVIEVNSFGGEDRQYQVVLDPKRLQASGISLSAVASALTESNANAGGGYIESNREHFVIGTDGLVKNLEDLKRVVVGATKEGVPVTVATVGDVRFGPRLRRGAASKDGKGEVVIGVALMLMGENSRTVTQAVKQKLAAITPSLPEGTRVEAFYDRSVLVDRTIGTVLTNLAEGAALVVAVLLLLLGNLRAGLVVAAVIPMALLGAVIAMKESGMSGNLMSLGAIDFGLLVDGAVIIVEHAVRKLAERRRELARELTSAERIDTVRSATLEVRSASLFGEAIIAIVYLPILSLTAVEGKLFRPMASTVLLALAGAFVMSLTLVPVLTSYLVKPEAERETFLLRAAQRLYAPLSATAMRHRSATVGIAVMALAGAIALATQIGAEFIPQLDEGSFVIAAHRLPGISLTESLAIDNRMQRALLRLPEVRDTVSRVGAPEIAIDPMGFDESDVYVSLRDRSRWRKGLTRDALASEVASVLRAAVPEVVGAVSQPIQDRTNELLAGVRADLAIKVFGRDMDLLATLGAKAARLVEPIAGVTDVRVEQVAGLQYLRIKPDRNKLARYGLTIADVNQLTETLAVGHSVGAVLEGERRFAMVVKVDNDFRGDLDPLRALPLRSLTGQVVPLGDVATLELVTGPAEVAREQQSRRISIELNVRGRDLVSVVNDVQAALAEHLTLPKGYRVEYGGQFQHYREAKARLQIVVPLSLALIGFLLWLAFRSARMALVIFLNVPFAVIGGVVALAATSIPFSISAGVGFIALFGVSVLNGLVLLAFAKQLEDRGASRDEAIQRAAELRLRPVLMTALVASLGFLPMALSTLPGSEVQRPLATVVIGGLLSSTLLTLFVLPAVYAYIGKRAARP